jgi:hypothetical protein
MKKILVLISACVACWIILGFSQQSDLIFSHKFHMDEAGAKCIDCHQAAFTSTSPKDNLLPAMQTCNNCHDEKETDCKICHSDPEAAGEVPRIISLMAKFAHQQHVKSEEDCKSCHAGVELQVSPSGSKHVPAPAKCAECHASVDYNEDKSSCLGCHEQNHTFKPADHTRIWKKDHGLVAQLNTDACGHCHQNSYCIQCHEGDNLDRLAHPLNYKTLHGIDARANKENCLTCHQESAFCIECHQNEMVMPRNHAYANWTNTNDGGMHKRQAESDMDYCMSCHNDEYAANVCIECHQNEADED